MVLGGGLGLFMKLHQLCVVGFATPGTISRILTTWDIACVNIAGVPAAGFGGSEFSHTIAVPVSPGLARKKFPAPSPLVGGASLLGLPSQRNGRWMEGGGGL